jgi:hypothetical protein
LRPTSVAEGVVLAALAGLIAWLAWRSLTWPLVHDAPLMHYIAWRLAEGAVPYRDVFDMNFPGVYLLHLFVVRGLGVGDLAWRLFDLTWLAGTALAAGAFAAPWGRLAAGIAAASVALYHLAGSAWQAGQRDFFLCPLLLLGALGVARWLERPDGARMPDLAWGGLALGASLTIKPHAVALAAALGLMVAVTAWRTGTGIVTPLACFVAGVALAPLAVVVWLALAGALPAWRAIVFDYLVPLYSRLGRAAPNVYRAWIWVPITSGVLLSIASALAVGRFRARHAVATVGVLYGLAHFMAQGKGWEYHLYPLAAFALVLPTAELAPALARLRRPVALPLLLSLALTLVSLTGKAMAVSPAGWERAKAQVARDLADEMAPRLRPGDTVQVLDTTGGGIHALLRLGVREPTRFLYDFHFFHDTEQPAIRALRAELIRGLDARPPRLIVVFEQGWPTGGGERVERFPELAERLARYDLVRPGPGYRIYAQRDR